MSGRVTRAKLTRKDIALWDGRTKTYSRSDASGGTVSGLVLNEEIDVLQVFGSGTSQTRISIADAIRYIGTSACTLLFSTGTWTIDDNLTIPANFTCHIPAGCVFSVSSGKTLTFSGRLIVEYPSSWTSGSGTVSVSSSELNDTFYRQTAAELAQSVTPTNYYIPSHEACGYVLPERYGSDNTGVADSATAFLNARKVATQSNREMVIAGGTYKSTATLQWGYTGLRISALGKVVINFTNSGHCIDIDGGSGGSGVYSVSVKGYIKAVGNASTTDAWYVRACHHSQIESRAGDCTTSLRTLWCVLTDFRHTVSVNEAAFSTLTPTTGISIEKRGSGETTSACNFYATVEGVSGTGIAMVASGSLRNSIIGGTSEGNGIGMSIATGNTGTVVDGMDFEGNVTNDILVTGGSATTFRNLNSISPIGATPNIDLQGGDNALFIGGVLRWVKVGASTTGTTFVGSQVADAGGVGIQGTGPKKMIGVQKIDGSFVVTSAVDDCVGTPLTFTPAVAGGSTAGTQAYAANGQKGYYTDLGHCYAFTLWIQLSSNSGGTGNAVISGFPFPIRNVTNGYQTFPVLNYTGITLGAAGRALALQMNPGTATGTLLETDTGSVSNFIAIGSVSGTATINITGVIQKDAP